MNKARVNVTGPHRMDTVRKPYIRKQTPGTKLVGFLLIFW